MVGPELALVVALASPSGGAVGVANGPALELALGLANPIGSANWGDGRSLLVALALVGGIALGVGVTSRNPNSHTKGTT